MTRIIRTPANPPTQTVLGAALIVVLLALVLPTGARANETVWSCGNGVNNVFAHGAVFGINTSSTCPANPYGFNGLQIQTAGNTVADGQRATWQANAPSGLIIVGAQIPQGQMTSFGINDGQQYGGGFYWAGGGAETTDGESSAGFAPLWSSYFGWQVICGTSPSCEASYNTLAVTDIALYVQETVGPTLVSPDGLWQASGWVRGDWPVHVYGDSPSGLCAVVATINNAPVASSGSGQDTSSWHQCSAPAISQTIHTWQDGQGAMPLALGASDAAGLSVNYTKTIYIDNQQPTVALSGPAEAPSTAGTQYVTATASAGPSGVAGISCSVDGAPAQWYPSSTARIPVSGIGQHQVQCASENNAIDGNGVHGTSPTESFSMRIGVPTVAVVAFSKIADKLSCHRVVESVRIPARWVKVRGRGKTIRVRDRAHTVRIKVTRCHARTGRRKVRVRVTVRRDGKKIRVWRKKTIRVLLEPHVVYKTRQVVGTAVAPRWTGGWERRAGSRSAARRSMCSPPPTTAAATSTSPR